MISRQIIKNYNTKEISLLQPKYCADVHAIYVQNGELRQTTRFKRTKHESESIHKLEFGPLILAFDLRNIPKGCPIGPLF